MTTSPSSADLRLCEGRRETCPRLALPHSHLCDACLDRESEAANERQLADYYGGSTESAESMNLRGVR